MRKGLILIFIVVILLLAACGEDATPTPVPATEALPEPESTEIVEQAIPTDLPPTEVAPTEAAPTEMPPASPLAEMEHVPDSQLIDILWEWQRRDSSPGGATEFAVPDPAAYTITFNEDGTFKAIMDCNSAAGQYATSSPGNIFMELGASTMAECEPDSLADQMANMFGPAQSYRFEEEGQVLVFSWVAGGPVDYYRDAATGPADEQTEADGSAQIEAIQPDAIEMDLFGLADSYQWEVRPGIASSPGPGGEGFPPHILMTFDGESAEEVLAEHGRRLYIFPTQAYIALYGAQGSSIVADQVARLEALIAEADSRQGLPESPMPLLPPPNSFMDRWVQFRDQNFGVGQGVRYVSDSPFRQAIGPWTNETTDYYYEGLTSDGTFYISLIWPVSTESLPDTAEDVPDDVLAAATDPDTYPTYLQETKDRLNALPASSWSPDLARLDAMAESLTFPIGGQSGLTGTTWSWEALSDPAAQMLVNDPSRYTILFNELEGESGTADIQADCNSVSATYTTEGNSINITLGPATLAACPADSLDQQFLIALEAAAIYFFQDSDLFLDLFAR